MSHPARRQRGIPKALASRAPAPRDPAIYEWAAADAARTAPAFGPALAWSGLVCGLWPVPSTGTAVPANAPGTPPILVVGTTNDPATPYVWAEALASQLPQGRLLRHEGEGHTAYGEDPCTTRIVDGYLLALSLPDGALRCRAAGGPSPRSRRRRGARPAGRR